MNPTEFLRDILDPGLDWFEHVTGITRSRAAARPFLLAVAMQESGLTERAQVVAGGAAGPARGWFQFERGGGVVGVLSHGASADLARLCCAAAMVRPTPDVVWRTIEGHDRLAVAFARLLMLTDPAPVPTDMQGAWRCYADRLWRPGKPHPDRWPEAWRLAQAACEAA